MVIICLLALKSFLLPVVDHAADLIINFTGSNVTHQQIYSRPGEALRIISTAENTSFPHRRYNISYTSEGKHAL